MASFSSLPPIDQFRGLVAGEIAAAPDFKLRQAERAALQDLKALHPDWTNADLREAHKAAPNPLQRTFNPKGAKEIYTRDAVFADLAAKLGVRPDEARELCQQQCVEARRLQEVIERKIGAAQRLEWVFSAADIPRDSDEVVAKFYNDYSRCRTDVERAILLSGVESFVFLNDSLSYGMEQLLKFAKNELSAGLTQEIGKRGDRLHRAWIHLRGGLSDFDLISQGWIRDAVNKLSADDRDALRNWCEQYRDPVLTTAAFDRGAAGIRAGIELMREGGDLVDDEYVGDLIAPLLRKMSPAERNQVIDALLATYGDAAAINGGASAIAQSGKRALLDLAEA